MSARGDAKKLGECFVVKTGGSNPTFSQPWRAE